MSALVSIIVPIYKVEDYLENCVSSIIRQIYKNLEIILVDDGSPDSCGKICDEFAKKDNRIKVIHKENGGLSDARNAGIRIATGEYLTFIDSDDYISDDYVRLLLDLVVDKNAEISICGLKKTASLNEDRSEKKQEHELKIMSPNEAITEMLYTKNFSTSVCGRLFKKNLFEEIIFPLDKFSEDMFTMYKLFLKSKCVVFSSKIAYFYYCRPHSIMTGTFQEKHLDVIEALHQIKKEVIDADSSLLPAYKNQIVEVVANIISKQPPQRYLMDNGLWDETKSYLHSVITNGNASKRARAQALLMIFGRKNAGWIIHTYYNFKWRR